MLCCPHDVREFAEPDGPAGDRLVQQVAVTQRAPSAAISRTMLVPSCVGPNRPSWRRALDSPSRPRQRALACCGMTVLIIGGSGFLGTELLREARAKGWDTAATFHSRPGDPAAAAWHQLDIRDPVRVEAVLTVVAPHAVINVTSGGADWKVTADGSIHIAMAIAKLGIRLTGEGVLFTDDVRCPVHVEDLAAALWELTRSDGAGLFHLAGPDALSRYDLGARIARRDGLDASRLPSGRRADTRLPGPLDVRLDSRATELCLTTRLRGAREFLGEA